MSGLLPIAFGDLLRATRKRQKLSQRQLAQRALAIHEQRVGPNHPQTAYHLITLASIYRSQQKYEQAESLCQRALPIREQHLGPDHPATALSINNLAAVYRDQGDFERAEPLLQRALTIHEQQLGDTHIRTAVVLRNLAQVAQQRGDYEQAEGCYQRALAIHEQRLGTSHVDTATILAGLAELAHQQGKHEAAEQLYQRALAIFEQRLGADHPRTQQLQSAAAVLAGRGEPIDHPCPRESDLSVLDQPQDLLEDPHRKPGPRLGDTLATVPDPRSAQGRRHPLPAVLALITAAVLSGARSLYAVARWGRIAPTPGSLFEGSLAGLAQ